MYVSHDCVPDFDVDLDESDAEAQTVVISKFWKSEPQSSHMNIVMDVRSAGCCEEV